ncbi:PhzF family phenazine biosynthesis protein [Stakelama saccharophila]|uniref:PhzF family phenazine biosynthesis protein n=1 Tax=Stakelama saccharophila TaxID=3075605 RepID=A0ABZ0B9T3_9SPHN|nr:PhzF family phenazine biosynthesis protein [Stakelama sp. W311]WNO53881.1 PhzF family phenazine biosynthesis protein [Stakelama sp. W311]
MKLPYSQVDAFADRPFAGNPAAVMPLGAWLSDELLQRIAAEHNLSETAFLIPDDSGEADYELRWFTPTTEVVLCGHATLASGHHVLSNDPARDRVTFRTRWSGLLEVARAGGEYRMALPVWRPDPKPMEAIIAALGLDSAVETLWNDNDYGLVIVESEEIVRNLRPDFRALADMGDVLIIVSARGSETDIVSRAFACGAGIDEDPVTGSAHAVLTPYWAEKLGRERFTACQASARGGYLTCELAGDRVILGGRCVTVAEGNLLLP